MATMTLGKRSPDVAGVRYSVWRRSLINLVKSGFAIEIRGLPATILQQYIWLRDMLFETVMLIMRHYGLTIPSCAKDVVLGYALIAGAFWRSFAFLTSENQGLSCCRFRRHRP